MNKEHMKQQVKLMEHELKVIDGKVGLIFVYLNELKDELKKDDK